MLDNGNRSWFIQGCYIREKSQIERLDKKQSRYDLGCLCNVLVAESIDDSNRTNKALTSSDSGLLTGTLVGAALGHPFLGASIGMLSSSSPSTPQKPTALLSLIFTDGQMKTFTVDKHEFAELQKQLLCNLQKKELSVGGFEQNDLTKSRISREVKNRIEIKSKKHFGFALLVYAVGAAVIFDKIRELDLSTAHAAIVVVSFILFLLCFTLSLIKEKTAPLFIDKREEEFVHRKLGDEEFNKLSEDAKI